MGKRPHLCGDNDGVVPPLLAVPASDRQPEAGLPPLSNDASS
jgi:hypothetical protein